MSSSVLSKIIFIVGPTAVGKSDVALALARRIPCEIISCDAMQVYREIDIASSKPSAAERRAVPHHLLDIVSVEEKFDVAMFNQDALAAIDVIIKNKNIPLVVGGSGMYMQVLLDGIFEGGGQNAGVRESLQARALKEGPQKLYAQLQNVDPEAAAKIHENDERRIVRALEVFESTRTPISQLQKNRSGLWGKYDVQVFGLTREREELYDMINTRVDKMFAQGLVDEIKAIQDKKLSLTASRIIGVKEVADYLDGKTDLNEAKEIMKMNTRRLAKRQGTWFRKDKRIQWIKVGPDDKAADVAAQIIKEIK